MLLCILYDHVLFEWSEIMSEQISDRWSDIY